MKLLMCLIVLMLLVGTTTQAQRVVTPGAGVFISGPNGEVPFPIRGKVAKLITEGKSPKLEFTEITCKIVGVKDYRSTVLNTEGLAEPNSGTIREAYINDKLVEVKSNDVSDGNLKTKLFGKVKLYSDSSLTSESITFAMTKEQFSKVEKWLKETVEKKPPTEQEKK